MQQLFKEQKQSLYQIQKDLNIDIKRLYRYADGTCKIKNMPSELLLKLADYFNLEPSKLYCKMIDYENEKEVNQNGNISNAIN